jgi:predicted ABC-type ATPase
MLPPPNTCYEKKFSMSKKLIFIGGAPGIGKSTIAGLLLKDLENCVWLDGDDLWRMNPFIVDENTKTMVEKNISFVLNSFIQKHFSYILFTWVLHLDTIVDKILSGLDQSDFNFMHYTLICDVKTLKERLSTDVGRTTDHSLAIKRLKESKNVKSIKIDTINKTVSEIVSILKSKIIS